MLWLKLIHFSKKGPGTFNRSHMIFPTMTGQLYGDVIKWEHFPLTGSLWGEFTGHRWIPLAKAIDAELQCFLWAAPEETVEQTIKTAVI